MLLMQFRLTTYVGRTPVTPFSGQLGLGNRTRTIY